MESMSGRRTGWGAALVAVALLAGACGGGGDDSGGAGGTTTSADAGEPQAGGEIIYGVEAETPGGFCLPEAQLAVSGIQVARSMFETLTAPDENGNYAPFLAK